MKTLPLSLEASSVNSSVPVPEQGEMLSSAYGTRGNTIVIASSTTAQGEKLNNDMKRNIAHIKQST
jgi:hypothetical protein